ncbi:hypothetical protein E0H93_28150 [Rhizobium leguminosarum bv. viciae]|uniref:hypothetical protein n=1 Tax=Rhizobium leguminosarum TaxID=384 RepID=UPI00103A4B58|nr:hypothetical protein [Rhizobium leguminosarum]TBY26966.1 hypothetical protein E0H55_28980 [Rhizobium leguminosarum bv. viciae]TCA99525.1 hypothetical protein E0H93_28150 [Rhizobium leguminosarum bv. viciae]
MFSSRHHAFVVAALVLIASFLTSIEAMATAKHTEVADDPRSFARSLVNFGAVEPVFMYCWADMLYFDNYGSASCIETIARLSIIARGMSIVPLSSRDRNSLRLVLEEIDIYYREKKDGN